MSDDSSCCCCLSQRVGMSLITFVMFTEALFMLNFAIMSTQRGEIISFVDWGIFTADMISVFMLLRALCYDSRHNRRQACFSIVVATFVLILLMALTLIWIVFDIDSAYPYLRHRTDKESQKMIMLSVLSLVTVVLTFTNTYFYLVAKQWARHDPSEEQKLIKRAPSGRTGTTLESARAGGGQAHMLM